jgi:hypothetical protein
VDIARFFGVTPTDLQRWNSLDLEAKLASNMVMQVWVPEDFDTSKVALVDPKLVRLVATGSEEFFEMVEARRGRKRVTYTVKRGDDLERVARKFSLKVADLERINRCGAAHTSLKVGQKLTVYVNMTPAERARATDKISPGGAEPAVFHPPTSDPGVSLDDQEDDRGLGVKDEALAEPGPSAPLKHEPSLPRPPAPDGKP